MAIIIKVGMADLNVCKSPDGITTLGLGSCVGVCIRDPIAKVGGMVHAMLPDSTQIENNSNRAKFADTGIEDLVKKLVAMGGNKARFESHKDYYDIQYIAKGTESFGMALVKDCELVETIEKNDVSFYKTPKFYTQVNLKSGDLVVVPPEEVHQPRAQYNGQKDFVVKVVIKVKV